VCGVTNVNVITFTKFQRVSLRTAMRKNVNRSVEFTFSVSVKLTSEMRFVQMGTSHFILFQSQNYSVTCTNPKFTLHLKLYPALYSYIVWTTH
jgi:hypothetical protein